MFRRQRVKKVPGKDDFLFFCFLFICRRYFPPGRTSGRARHTKSPPHPPHCMSTATHKIPASPVGAIHESTAERVWQRFGRAAIFILPLHQKPLPRCLINYRFALTPGEVARSVGEGVRAIIWIYRLLLQLYLLIHPILRCARGT